MLKVFCGTLETAPLSVILSRIHIYLLSGSRKFGRGGITKRCSNMKSSLWAVTTTSAGSKHRKLPRVRIILFCKAKCLAPTGAQEMLISVRPFQVCLEQSIFIFLGQRAIRALREKSESNQSIQIMIQLRM